jgi:hypothetical protein
MSRKEPLWEWLLLRLVAIGIFIGIVAAIITVVAIFWSVIVGAVSVVVCSVLWLFGVI